MTKVESLTNELFDLFDKVKKNEIDCTKARLMNNISGRIINSACAQMRYNKAMGMANRKIDSFE